jgi:transporter family protein
MRRLEVPVDGITIALAVGACLCWALTWILMKLGVDLMDWVVFGTLRSWAAILFIVPYVLLTHSLILGAPIVVGVAVGGSLLNAFLGTALFYYALAHGAIHESTILSNTNPLWGVISSVIFLGEGAGWTALVAAALVIGGASLLVHRTSEEPARSRTLPRLAALGAGVLWGFTGAVPTKYCLNHGMSPSGYQLIYTSVAIVAWTLASAPKLMAVKKAFTKRALWIALVSSFFGIFASWLLWLTALRRVEASILSPLQGLGLLFTVALGVVFLHERVTLRLALGGLLVVAGASIVSILGQ